MNRNMIGRKLITTVFVTAMVSLAMGWFFTFHDSGASYHMGDDLIGWSFVYAMYIGAIILVYGNIVSIGLELAQKKWFSRNQWLYAVLHGVFGLANGLFFLNGPLAVIGAVAALFYAFVDRWILYQSAKQKNVDYIVLIPILIYMLAWGVFEYISPEEPPFTKEDAVEFATSGEGTITDVFPEKIGKCHGVIEEYEVTRETAAKKTGKEKYIVTFTETWKKKDGKTGSWSMAYEVERDSMSALYESGEIPVYYGSSQNDAPNQTFD
ncbi:hypothetical protein [Siminovitchia fortis]|uniref:Uncharacterized protein n=1 Tax=Siminovitchia fortis TaxID=254758 RepID=A0A443J0S9_9BACI|nr:hypothetical protein [Siminovitchia fortis]RWR14010.1 hypothetical protein D4N35_003710 [Siminovitchia fortis]WHY81141.1 hypothetical protein QNH23_14725 [Siminovitchia fortis]